MNEIDVTIICLCFNHEKYIAKTLEGFLNQKTKYKFEIIIHDDASTDSSRKIIESFHEKYPNLIYPYYETKNQYTNPNSFFVRNLINNKARGRYIAFCDGDDYWIENDKIERQVIVLDNYKNIDICACETLVEFNGKIIDKISPSKTENVLSFENVVNGGGDYVGTASLMFRKKLFDNYPVPERIGTLDYIMQMCGSINGGMYYINKPMCVYRKLTNGSWTRNTRFDLALKVKTYNDIILALKRIDEFTNNSYKEIIDKKIKEFTFEILFAKSDYKKMKSTEFVDLYNKVSFKRKIKKILLDLYLKIRK